jgi:Sulfotransferase family
MILSHSRRFIFIKTLKTASTSIEVALRSACGPEDVITPIGHKGEPSATRGPQNYLRGTGERETRSDGRSAPLKDRDFYNHMPLRTIAAYVGDATIANYRKIAFVRNPWDRQVSLYHFYAAANRARDSFQEWMAATKRLSCWDMITLNGELALDFIGRYESLSEDVARMCALLRISPLELPRLKTGFRPDKGYHHYYTPELRDRVARHCAREIEAFGYSFS